MYIFIKENLIKNIEITKNKNLYIISKGLKGVKSYTYEGNIKVGKKGPN